MKPFPESTSLVLELPKSGLSEAIMKLRRKFDPWRAVLPVEITIAGSSGIGVFDRENQDMDEAYRIVELLSSQLEPFEFSFNDIESFPHTNIFYLQPAQPEVFQAVQDKIIETGLKFEPTPYAFTPHCTIVNLGENPAESAVEEVLALPIPKEAMHVGSLGIYSLTNNVCRKLREYRLGK